MHFWPAEHYLLGGAQAQGAPAGRAPVQRATSAVNSAASTTALSKP